MAKSDERKQSSIFDLAIIGAPPVIGAGIGISRLRKNSSFFSAPIIPITNPSHDAIRKFTNRYANPEHSGVIKDYQLDKLANLSKDIPLTVEDARASIMRAAAQADPTGATSSMFTNQLSKATSASELIEDLAGAVSRSSSIYTQRAVSLFMEDMNILSPRVSQGLSLSTEALTSMVPKTRRNLALSSLSPRLGSDIQTLAEKLGASVSITEFGRKDLAGSELHLRFRDSEKFKGGFTLRIPRALESNPSVITRGFQQQSRYIAGTYGLIEGGVLKQSFNHEEWMARRAVEDLIPKITRDRVLEQREVRNLVSSFEQKLIEAPEWVPTIEAGKHAGIDEYIKQRSPVMRLFTAADKGGVRPINEYEYYNLMKQGGARTSTGELMPMFPAFSPAQIAKGTVSLKDVRGSMAFVPEAVPYGRRPLQFVRSGASPLSPELIANDPLTQRFGWAKAQTGVATPMVHAAYVSSSLDAKLANTGITSEGQLILSNRLGKMRGVSQWKQFDIAADKMVDLAGMVEGEGKGGFWNLNKKAAAGTFLGYDPSGKPVVLGEGMNLLHATSFEKDAAKGNFIRVMATQDIEDMKYSKVFGGAKGMAVSMNQGYVERILRNTGVSWTGQGAQLSGIDALITMDELKKNRGLHYNQMFTALWDFTNQNIQSGKSHNLIASNFANNPMKVISKIRARALNQDKFSHEAMLSNIKLIARGANLTPEQMGRVFGAVPDVFGDLSALGRLSPAETAEISRGVATGMTQLWFEGLGGPGAGKTATIEPRTFELLGAPHFGSVGPLLQSEIAERAIAANPTRLLEQTELDEAIASVRNLGERTEAVSPSSIKIDNDLLPAKATSMRIEGMGDIYIPGSEQVKQLAAFKTGSGKYVKSPLAGAYADVITGAQQFQAGEIDKSVMVSKLGSLESELFNAKLATITGTGGLLRGRMPGSAFLTAVQPTLREQLPANTVGITSPMAERMFREMEGLGIYKEAEMNAMRKKFASGEAIAGTLGRHPYIGPYSTQAAMFQKVSGDEPIAMIAERQRNAIAFRGRLNEQALSSVIEGAENAFRGNQKALERLNQVGGEMLGSPLRLSPFVGLAGDVDGDIVSATFAGPQLQKTLTSHINDPDIAKRYEEYAIRSQVLKAKAGADSITLRSLMAGDAAKLGITQTGRLGKLSTQLQQYRAAVLGGYGGLSDQSRMDALGLLEWMEQTPISGKHIKPGREVEMFNLLDDIQEGLDKKNANGIAEAARAVMAQSKMSGQAALNEGMTVAMEDLEGGVSTRYIPGLDISKSTENLVNASRAMEAAKIGNTSASRMREMAFGRAGQLTAEDKAALYSKKALEMTPFGSFFTQSKQGLFSAISERSLTAANKMGAMGKSLIPLAKPLAIGSAVGLGLAAVLSEPPRVLPAGSTVAPMPSMESGTGGRNMGYGEHPHEQMRGQPTARDLTGSQHTARLSQQEDGYRVGIQGGINENIDINSLNSQIQQSLGRARINSTVRDLRGSLTPQRISSILQND